MPIVFADLVMHTLFPPFLLGLFVVWCIFQCSSSLPAFLCPSYSKSTCRCCLLWGVYLFARCPCRVCYALPVSAILAGFVCCVVYIYTPTVIAGFVMPSLFSLFLPTFFCGICTNAGWPCRLCLLSAVCLCARRPCRLCCVVYVSMLALLAGFFLCGV